MAALAASAGTCRGLAMTSVGAEPGAAAGALAGDAPLKRPETACSASCTACEKKEPIESSTDDAAGASAATLDELRRSKARCSSLDAPAGAGAAADDDDAADDGAAADEGAAAAGAPALMAPWIIAAAASSSALASTSAPAATCAFAATKAAS